MSALVSLVVVAVLAGCSDNGPSCLTIQGQLDPLAPDLVVDFRPGIDGIAEADTLSTRYGFAPISHLSSSGTMVIPAPQPQTVLDGLRCEPSVQDIWYDVHTTVFPSER
jgi:hypothetical protein